jgi:hypothetical protein
LTGAARSGTVPSRHSRALRRIQSAGVLRRRDVEHAQC